MRSAVFTIMAVCLCAASVRADEDDVFGQAKQSEAALMGVLYDLKQTQERKPTTVDPSSYISVVDEFLSQGWDESVLNRYYRVGRPLFTTQIFIPSMNADNAPKAFGAEKTVKPSRWVIHYKGQVSAPEPGTYRFWGIADDWMAAAVNGKTVLIGARRDMASRMTKSNWQSPERKGAHAGDGDLAAGDWFTLKSGEIIDLDVAIGERPGGVFNAFLMIEKQGAAYETDSRGHLILPIFQVARFDTPKTNDAQFASGAPPWKSYQ